MQEIKLNDMNIKERKNILSKINLTISFLFILFFGLLLLPNNVLAGNCCEKVITTYAGGMSGGSIGNSVESCANGESLTKDECASGVDSYSRTKATFLENASCNAEKTKCVADVAITEPAKTEPVFTPINFTFNVPLPGLESTMEVNPGVLPKYIEWLYRFIIGIAGLLAVFMITIGGLMWIFAGGNGSKIGKAREYIFGAIIGLLLAIFSYSILYIINPELVVNKFPDLTKVEKVEIEKPIDPGIISSIPNSNLVKVDDDEYAVLLPVVKQYQMLREDTNEAYKRALSCMKAKKQKLQIFYFTRSLEDQKRLYAGWIAKKPGFNLACNPANGINGCPHTSGAAIDVGCFSGYPCTQQMVQECFLQAGFCRLQSETWHFEYPLRSTGGGNLVGFSSDCSIIDKRYAKATFSTNDTSQIDNSIFDVKVTNDVTMIFPKNNPNIKNLVVFYHGITSDSECNGAANCGGSKDFQTTCNIVVNSLKNKNNIAIACANGHNKSASSWANSPSYFNKAIGEFNSKYGKNPDKYYAAGHSAGGRALAKLQIDSATDEKIEKFIYLDANYNGSIPECTSKVVGADTLINHQKLTLDCTNRIQNYTGQHYDAIGYIVNYLP